MDIITLHQELQKAYSSRNLNSISLTLINLYKNEQFGILQKIADIIGDYFTIEIGEDGKGFSKLMMLYHPDRMGYKILKSLSWLLPKLPILTEFSIVFMQKYLTFLKTTSQI